MYRVSWFSTNAVQVPTQKPTKHRQGTNVSGRKQHYIPQVLLKGFSTFPDAKAPPIFVYSRNRGCYRTNTKDSAAEREFYSTFGPDTQTLDDSITDYENQLAKQLNEIKTQGIGPLASALPSTVVTHLAIRNDHTRKIFADIGGKLLGAVGQAFGDATNVRAMMGFDAPYDSSPLKQELRKTLDRLAPGLSKAKRTLLEARLVAHTAANFDQFFAQQKAGIAQVNTKLRSSIGEMARGSHVKALAGSLAPEARIEALSKLRWAVVAGDFLLPDCVAIAINADGSINPYILNTNGEFHAVFMPISKELGLFGAINEDDLPENALVNEISASCSADFFLYTVDAAAMRSFVPLIGTKITEVVAQMTDEAVKSSNLYVGKSRIES